MVRSHLSTMTFVSCALAALPMMRAEPPEGYQGTVRLGGASAPRGSEARLPYYIHSNPATQAFVYSIDFDEEVLEARAEMEHVFVLPNGAEWDFVVHRVNNANETPGNGGVDEGFLVGAVIFSLTEDITLPVDVETEVGAFSVTVKPDAPIGTTELRFLDGALLPREDNPIPNQLTLGGVAVPPDTKITPVFVQALLQIIPDISIFLRGDTNGDAAVDIADVGATLDFLFKAAPTLACLDAADANDDGKLNITDPIITLQYLFLGRATLPAPSGTGGEDPTPDAIDCGR